MDFCSDVISSIIEYVGQRSIWIISFATLSFSCYCYDRHYYNYWKRKGIPSPPTKFFFGNILDCLDSHLSIYHAKLCQTYGPIYGFYIFTEKVIGIQDIELLRKILIDDRNIFTDRNKMGGHPLESLNLLNQNGQQWKQDRTILSKSFSSGKMKGMYPLMKNCYILFENELINAAKSNKQVDIKDLFSKLTSMVIARCAFATHVDAFSDPDNKLLFNLRKYSEMSNVKGVAVNLLPNVILKLFKIGIFDSSASTYVANVCREILKQRRARSGDGKVQDYDDLLQIMTDSRGENGEKLTDEKIIANAGLFFAAGHDTTTSLLTWISYVLIKHPQVQEKLYQEIERARGKNSSLNYEILFELKYLDAVVNETLRLYTPVSMHLRVNVEDYFLPNGILLEKGTSVHIPSYAIHHNSKFFHEAETFNPERFIGQNKDSIDPCTFLPFSLGPRSCIGMRFALLVTKMTVAEFISKFRLVPSENTPNEPVLANHPIIVQLESMFLRPEIR